MKQKGSEDVTVSLFEGVEGPKVSQMNIFPIRVIYLTAVVFVKVGNATAKAGKVISMKLDDPRLWTPQHPFLYKMEVESLDIQQCKLFFRSGLALETKSTLMLVSEPFNLPRKEKRKPFFSMENHWIFRLLLCLNSVYILFNVLKILGCIDIVSRLVPWTKATGLTDSLLLLVKKR